MARYSDVITLRKVTYEVSDEGAVKQVYGDTDVFFNRYSVSLQQRLAGAAEGLQGMVEGQIRSVDYDGQELALIGGVEYTVNDTNDTGEFCTLTLSKRLANG